MATWKFTAKMGQQKGQVVLSAGSAIAGSDAIELNVDRTTMTKREFVATLETLTNAAIEAAFPAV